jgi:hypothetical protein
MRLGAPLADEIKSQLLCQLSYAPLGRELLAASEGAIHLIDSSLAGTLRCEQTFIVP